MEADRRAIIILTVGIVLGVLLSLGVAVFTGPYERSTEEQVSIQEEEIEVIGSYYNMGMIEMHKVHDNKDNVTCWLYRGTQKGGISCIPDHLLVP